MQDRRRARLLAVVILFTLAVFIVDLLSPLGGTAWVLYLPVILAPVWFDNPRQILVATAACTVLVIVGFLLSHLDSLPWQAVRNRGMGILALWLMAFVGTIICKRSLQLADTMTSLQQEMAEHERSQRALAQSEERLRLAVEGAGMGTWDVDLRTSHVVWSETHLRMFGYDPESTREATREMWRCRVHPDDLPRVLEAQSQARGERTLHSVEYRIIRADNGAIVWLAVFGRFLYDEAGEPIRFLGVSFDVTPRKVLEREVLEIAAREQRRIGQELHDGVGQELTGLGLMANALVQRRFQDAAQQRIATRLLAELDRVQQQVRALSRGLVPVHVEARGLCAALDDLAASTSEQSGIPIGFDCPEAIEVPDHATATELFHIAQEALSNALRHGQPRQVRLSLRRAAGGLCLGIQDDGAGTQDRPKDGNGIGLRIMRHRAEQIGGVLHIGSAAGGGTVVTCTLSGRGNNANEDPRSGVGRGERADRR
jgi:PAS domain S-box-containing protein